MRLLLLFLLLSLFSCDLQPTDLDPSNPDLERQLTYLALGDSYTIGTSVEEVDRWPMQLAARLRDNSIDIANPDIIARAGWSTDQLIAAIDAAEELDSVYDLVSLAIGVNNQFRGNPLSQYRRELPLLLTSAIALSGEDKERVFMISIPDYGLTPFGQSHNPQQIAEEIDIYNALADSICRAMQIAFYDITKVSRQYGTDPTYIAPDNLHPNSRMYAAWVEEIYEPVRAKVD